MQPQPSRWDGIKHVLGIKPNHEIASDVENEPTIRSARKALDRADRILEELEALEGGETRWRSKVSNSSSR